MNEKGVLEMLENVYLQTFLVKEKKRERKKRIHDSGDGLDKSVKHT